MLPQLAGVMISSEPDLQIPGRGEHGIPFTLVIPGRCRLSFVLEHRWSCGVQARRLLRQSKARRNERTRSQLGRCNGLGRANQKIVELARRRCLNMSFVESD